MKSQDSVILFNCRNLALNFLVRVFSFGQLSRRLQLLHEHVAWVNWAKDEFGRDVAMFSSREALWENVLHKHTHEQIYDVYEFGVAHGYTTDFFLSRAPNDLIGTWFAFDTFTGLPSPWRENKAGDFANGGKPPEIQDDRIQWVIGLVQETFGPECVSSNRKIVLFDLDLYEPTSYVFDVLTPYLGIGDLIYFDESFDSGELKIIQEQFIPHFQVKCLGITHVAGFFMVTGRRN